MNFRIVLMGAPGAGKGTQASRLAEAHGVPHISTGDIFRNHMEQGTELGNEVRKYIDEGHLAPDELACAIVDKRLAEADCASGYILDGFPRTVQQAECFEQLLERRGEKLHSVVNIAVSDDEIVQRLSSRWVCPKCGAIYNVRTNPPKKNSFCDGTACDGVNLVQRPDDEENTVRERLRVHHRETEPILGFYKDRGMLKTVPDTSMTPDQVFDTIEYLIGSAGRITNGSPARSHVL